MSFDKMLAAARRVQAATRNYEHAQQLSSTAYYQWRSAESDEVQAKHYLDEKLAELASEVKELGS